MEPLLRALRGAGPRAVFWLERRLLLLLAQPLRELAALPRRGGPGPGRRRRVRAGGRCGCVCPTRRCHVHGGMVRAPLPVVARARRSARSTLGHAGGGEAPRRAAARDASGVPRCRRRARPGHRPGRQALLPGLGTRTAALRLADPPRVRRVDRAIERRLLEGRAR